MIFEELAQIVRKEWNYLKELRKFTKDSFLIVNTNLSMPVDASLMLTDIESSVIGTHEVMTAHLERFLSDEDRDIAPGEYEVMSCTTFIESRMEPYQRLLTQIEHHQYDPQRIRNLMSKVT